MTYQNVFIIGNPRSGTSLFRMLIGSHSSIIVPPECGFIQWWYIRYKDWNVENSKSDEAVFTFVSDLKTSKKIETWDLNYDALKELIKKKLPTSYKELTSLVIFQYGLQKGKRAKFLGDKNNYYIEHLELLKTIYPKAKFLVIIRDPRDVVCSYLKVNSLKTDSKYKPKFPNNISEITLDWVENNTKILQFLNSIDAKNYAIIKYEELLIQPQIELQKCTQVLGLPFENQMLDYYQNNMEPSELLDWKKKTNQQIDKSNTNKYLEQLSSDEILEINTISKDLMNTFNYN